MNDVRRKQLEIIKEALENLQEPTEKIRKSEQEQAEDSGNPDFEANVELLVSAEKGIQTALMCLESILEL